MLNHSAVIPELITPLTESLLLLERSFLSQQEKINEWFDHEWRLTPPPVYGSVDLRNAGFKIAPIDMNLFPAGFNNLNPHFLSLSVAAAKKTLQYIRADLKKILIIPESHTRNIYYWENIRILKYILNEAGFEVRLGVLNEEIKTAQSIMLSSGENLEIEPLLRSGSLLSVSDFVPDLILLNNDLSEGIPDILQKISQPLVPPAELGWSQRLKSEHFQYYAEVVDEFFKILKLDPWLVAPLFRHCGEIDFMQQEGMACLSSNAEILFDEIKNKYAEYGISHQPFLIIKADAGTYGMAVMTLRHPDELKSLNRKMRTRMSMTKGGQPVKRVIIQEGVYTFEVWGKEKSVAEPVVYLWGEHIVGGFYRVHDDRGIDESLNAPGMHFKPIAFSEACHHPCEDTLQTAGRNRFYLYGVIAKLSMLAAAREIKDQLTL